MGGVTSRTPWKAGTWWLLKRNGWSWQRPARRAIERDDEVVELWTKEVWPAAGLEHCAGTRGLDRLSGRGRTVDDGVCRTWGRIGLDYDWPCGFASLRDRHREPRT
ncbi:winged helix-turn-helix domain-containing protein [Streptomyces carpinensis]|uniref:Winged helix-turn-helix domain-containing protein n=1 Tax=Streptomyces carpinensis TaxID=66369 RepID=A0ABV1VZX4_9ACTN